MPIVNPLPNTIANGQLEDAVPVMANLNWLVSQVNGNACPATSGSGILKGNGTGGTSTAAAGTDYAGITSVNTFTQLQSGIAATAAANFPITSQVQQSAFNTGASGGTVDAITVTFTPTITSLTSAPIWWRATGANATATPTLKRDGLAAKTIVKESNRALVAGDIPGAGAWMCSQYDATLDKEVLLNPATTTNIAGGVAGGVPYQSGPNTTAILAAGTNGQFLKLVAGIPAWAYTFQRSADVTPLPSAGGSISVNHTLGYIPYIARLECICLTAELGYSIGDVVEVLGENSASSFVPLTTFKSSTNVSIQLATGYTLDIKNKTTGAAGVPTPANWAYRLVLG